MRRDIIRIGAVTVIILMLSSLAVADEPSFATKLIRWLRSSISIFTVKVQTTADKQNKASLRPRAMAAPRNSQVAKLTIFYNYPNPFIPELGTDFICKLIGEAALELRIYNMNGALIRQLSWESSEDPPHWDGEDTIGGTIRTGIYIYSLKVTDTATGEITDSRYGKMMAWYMY